MYYLSFAVVPSPLYSPITRSPPVVAIVPITYLRFPFRFAFMFALESIFAISRDDVLNYTFPM